MILALGARGRGFDSPLAPSLLHGRGKAKSTPRGIRTRNPQIRSLMRYPVAPAGLMRLAKSSLTGI